MPQYRAAAALNAEAPGENRLAQLVAPGGQVLDEVAPVSTTRVPSDLNDDTEALINADRRPAARGVDGRRRRYAPPPPPSTRAPWTNCAPATGHRDP